jgi:beta-galactosidase/beta-glucuronidase
MTFRMTQSLNGPWRFQPDPLAEGVRRGYFQLDTDITRWREVALPASFEQCMPDLIGYEGDGWFRRDLKLPTDWRGRRIVLRFAAVNFHASVWFNGVHLGDQLDGLLPFSFSVEKLVRWDQANTVIVRVDNLRRKGEVPGLQRAWLPLGGILRDIDITAMHPVHIEHVSVVADPRADKRQPLHGTQGRASGGWSDGG